MVVGTLDVTAASITKNIQALYNNIKVVVDGKTVGFNKDSAGNTVESFIYNGTTYIPIRAVGEAFGKDVNWDGKTQTVHIGEGLKTTQYLTQIVEPYSRGAYTDIFKLSSREKLKFAGKEYKTGYLARKNVQKLQFNLDSKYRNLNFDFGVSYENTWPSTIKIYLDNELYKAYDFKGNDPAKNIDIDIEGVDHLAIEFGSVIYDVGIGNPIVQ